MAVIAFMTNSVAATKVSNPFYLFQLYTILVSIAKGFHIFSAVVVVGTAIAVGASVWETRKVCYLIRYNFFFND